MDINTEMIGGIATALVGSLFTIVFFFIQKWMNSRADKQVTLESGSKTVVNLVESIEKMTNLYEDLSSEIEQVKKDAIEREKSLQTELENERSKRRKLGEKIENLEKEKERLGAEVLFIKKTFKEEREKLLQVIIELAKQLKEAGIDPDTKLLDAVGVSIGTKNNKI